MTDGADFAGSVGHAGTQAKRGPNMTRVVQSVDVKVPVSSVYNQWTQFEDFPRFMEGVKSVQQIDDTHL